ncbi:hypothetical protein [Streptobacillus moniliformis]|uniref:hypothetical protein n=1 Tax=Streptobacillus moniliformis TaxID=34105 RepID=UPI0009BF0E1B|nr:hypothetical protein [Streptobacillus moniliformis]
MRTKIKEFLKNKENYSVYKDMSEIPEHVKKMIYENDVSIGYSRDLITPLSDDYGLERLFKYIKEYQPITYNVLKKAKNLMYGVFEKDFLTKKNAISGDYLGFELNGTALILDRGYYGSNPDQEYFEERMNGRRISLPKELAYSYYYEFIGLGFPVPDNDFSFRNLPLSIYDWDNLDGYLEEIGINVIDRKRITNFYTVYFSKLLNKKVNAEYMYTFMNTNIYGPGVNDNDYAFFVFEDIEYGDIYVIKNGDYLRPEKLINPVEAIDKYVAHVLSGKDNFNFDPYLEKLKRIYTEENKENEIELEVKCIIEDKEKIVDEIMSLFNFLEIDEVCYKIGPGEYEHISHFNFEEDEIEIVGFIRDEEGNLDFKMLYLYKDGKHLLKYSKFYEIEIEKRMMIHFLKTVSNNSNIKERKKY